MQKPKNSTQKKLPIRSHSNLFTNHGGNRQENSLLSVSDDESEDRRLSEEEQKCIMTILRKYGKQSIKRQGIDFSKQIKKVQQVQSPNAAQDASIQRRSDLKLKADTFDLSVLMLERIQIDPRLESIQSCLHHEFLKINELASRLEGLINKYHHESGYKLMATFAHYLNNLILTTNFMIAKLGFNYEQVIQQSQKIELVNLDLRAELRSLQNTTEILKEQAKESQIKQNEFHQQVSRLRSVIQSYQAQNFQLKSQLQVLRQVIQEMNVQVEKGEKKVDAKTRELIELQGVYERLVIYSQELEMEVREQVSSFEESQKLQKINEMQEMELRKWKNRCFIEASKYEG